MPEVRAPFRLAGIPGRLPVKVCGLTRAEDAALAWELGASALGFIFVPKSPRFVSPESARAIRERLPGDARCVGVFVDATAEDMQRITDFVGLTAVQLHGHESADLQRKVSPALKVVRSVEEAQASPADLVLVDASLPGVLGGTGLRADWDLASRIARQRPLVLAGGIGPENIAEAITVVRPHAVDVNSAVESSPGVKDHVRMKALFNRLSVL